MLFSRNGARPLCFVVILMTAAAVQVGLSESRIRYTNVAGARYLFLSDVADFYSLTYETGSDWAKLSSRWSQLKFRAKRRKAQINGVAVHLALAPAKWKNNILLSRADFLYTLDPLLRPSFQAQKSVKHIVLDPGHGGKDKGTSGKHLIEKELVLDIAELAKNRLQRKGYEVQLTRKTDKKVRLKKRSKLSRRYDADLFISIHANNAANEGVSGIETFILPPSNTPSTHNYDKLRNDYPAHDFNRSNACVAYSLQQHLIEATGADDRGVKRANFSVLRHAVSPAALVEVGFLSNPQEEQQLRRKSYRKKLANGIVQGVRRYHERISRKN